MGKNPEEVRPAPSQLLIQQISIQPDSALPAILAAVIRACLRAKTYKDRRLSDIVAGLEKQLGG